jgi:hypothetical protein
VPSDSLYPSGVALTLIEEAICEANQGRRRASLGVLSHEPNTPLLRPTGPARPRFSTSLAPATAFVDGAIPVTVQPGWLRI